MMMDMGERVYCALAPAFEVRMPNAGKVSIHAYL
jgi:hypothetical protein